MKAEIKNILLEMLSDADVNSCNTTDDFTWVGSILSPTTEITKSACSASALSGTNKSSARSLSRMDGIFQAKIGLLAKVASLRLLPFALH